jgi:hypothetical protein
MSLSAKRWSATATTATEQITCPGAARTSPRRYPFAALPVRKGIAKRDRVLSDQEIAEIWRATGDVASPVRLLILTGRRGAVSVLFD